MSATDLHAPFIRLRRRIVHEPPSLARRPVTRSGAVRAEVLEMRSLNSDFRYESDTPNTQIVFPVEGMHYIGTGGREVLLGLNQVAFIPRGIVTKDRHSSLGNVTCIVVTPSPTLLDEVWRVPMHSCRT
jgi:hypothetical protein